MFPAAAISVVDSSYPSQSIHSEQMSHSPTASLNGLVDYGSSKKRRLSGTIPSQPSPSDRDLAMSSSAMSQQQPHIPKRGARACTACRKGKNRCEGESPCRRCQLSGTPCVFEKPEKKNVQPQVAGPSIERLSRLEGQYLVMQSQMIGMQSSLDRILAAVQNMSHQQGHPRTLQETPNLDRSAAGPSAVYEGGHSSSSEGGRSRKFPPLPGFAPPPHKYASYGIVPSTTPSSEDESEDTLPRSTLNAPIEALQGLANAAAEAAAAPTVTSPRVKKRKKAEPIPRNAFPHVVEKGLVSDAEARELYHIFFAGCHLFIPLFDPSYDTYESLMERTPWTFDAILAVAGKIRSGNGPLSPTFYKCLEEAQGIARSSLFGPVVRKEAVQGMLLLAAWSTNGWLPSGHAMRMALDLGLHRALEKLAEDTGKQRTEAEERDLVVSARIWLCLYWFDHQMSLGTGRPIVLRDESSIRHCRLLLSHPMMSPTDVRLISQVELIAQKTQIYETLAPLNGQVNHTTLAFIRRANQALDKWWQDCDELHRQQSMDEESLMRKILEGELHYAKLWLVCVALRGVSWDKMPFEQRELAFQAKDSAFNCLSVFLGSPAYRAALRYSVHDSLVTAAFSGLFLLKMANLFPGELDLTAITAQVEQLAAVLSDVAAERYALTLRIMLANLRRKLGIYPGSAAAAGGSHLPSGIAPPSNIDGMINVPGAQGAGGQQSQQPFVPSDPTAPPPPFTMEELGMASWWPNERGVVSPSSIPIWLQEQACSILGINLMSKGADVTTHHSHPFSHSYHDTHPHNTYTYHRTTHTTTTCGASSPHPATPAYLLPQSLTDLGLPVNGSDGIFLQMPGQHGWAGDLPPMPEAW